MFEACFVSIDEILAPYGGLPMTISKPSFEGQQYVIDTMLPQDY